MNDNALYCIECGEPCDESYVNCLGEPLCKECALDLGYTDETGEPL